jgi:CheY-like chemotaxis protein
MYAPQVLLVEDNLTQARVLRECIKQLGLQTLGTATTAAEAIYLCINTLPAVAVIDVDLKGRTTGIEVARQLLRLGTVPIIFISTMDDRESVARLWSVKPLVVLAKPLNPQFLQRIIKAVLEEPYNRPAIE